MLPRRRIIRLCQFIGVKHGGRIGRAAIGELSDVERTADGLPARRLAIGYPAEGRGTTVHANTAQGALEQLTLLVKDSEGGNDLDRHDISALLRSLVDIVVQMHRLPPGEGQSARYRMTEVWFEPASKPHN